MENRKIFFLRVLLTLFFASTIREVYADYGSMVLHKAKFVLKNGSSVTGYIPLHAYNVSMADYKDISQDKAFQKLLNKYFYIESRTLTFKVYKKYKTLISPENLANASDKEFFYTDSASVCTLHLDSIKYTVYISGQDKPSLFWRQIEVFNLNTVDLMAHGSAQHYTVIELFNSSNYFIRAHFFCFDSNLSNTEFKNAIQNFGKTCKPNLRSDSSNYRGEAKALEKIRIVVFFWAEGSC